MSHSGIRLWCLPALLGLASCGGGDDDDNPPPGNAAPTLQAQSFAANEDAALTATVVAQDPGDTLTFSVVSNPSRGTLTLTSAGAFIYQPNANLFGADSFTVKVTDSASNNAQAVMTVNVANVNDAPAADDDVLTLTSAADIDVLANDTDLDNDTLTVSIVGDSFPSGATVGANGRITVPVAAGFKGMVRVRYRVTDPAGLVADATALGFVDVPPLKVLFVGSPVGTAHSDAQIVLNDFLSATSVGATNNHQVVELSTSRNGKTLVYKDRIGLGGSHRRHELHYVDLEQPDQRHPITGEVSEGLETARTIISDDGRRVVYHFSVVGVGSSIYAYDTQSPATLGQRFSPPATELQLADWPVFNATQSSVYYGGRQPWVGPGNPPSAAFRTDFATGMTTRVSPLQVGPTVWTAVDWVMPTPDESVIITHRLDEIFVNDPHNTIQVNSPLTPDTAQLLHIPAPAAVSFEVPLVSPDGLYAVLFGSERLTLARTDTPQTETDIGPDYHFAWEFVPDFRDRERIMRSDSKAALLVSGCNPPAPAGKACDVWEVTFADPANPVRVNAPNADFTGSSLDPAYAAGNRIVFNDYDAVADHYTLKLVQRGSFGTETTISAPGHNVARYLLDASGQMVLYTAEVSGQSDYELFLVNIDAPGSVLAVGHVNVGDPLSLTAR